MYRRATSRGAATPTQKRRLPSKSIDDVHPSSIVDEPAASSAVTDTESISQAVILAARSWKLPMRSRLEEATTRPRLCRVNLGSGLIANVLKDAGFKLHRQTVQFNGGEL